ncbi:MAG: putative dioxygenase [Acidimicrobiales bacterium]|nr:putative dioxygenase [Acidimicrobiales bacterium]
MSETETETPTGWPEVRFGPRRLGHVNLFVGDLDASFAFYHDVCGIELAFDETDLLARFLSNGNSHHDVAIMQATTRSLVGRDGQVQVSSERGATPGLNHFAYELRTEAELVAGIERARALDCTIDSLYDHLISRSAYLPAPDGVEIEVYADSTTDWRGLYAGLASGLMSARWEPGADGPPNEVPQFTEVPVHQPTEGAVARPLRTARAALVTAQLDEAITYYERVVGLQLLEVDRGAGRWAILGGSLGQPDLLLLERLADEPLGYHHVGLELADLAELAATVERAGAAGIPIERTVAHAKKQGIVLRDPDGMAVELFAHDPHADPSTTYASVVTAETRDFLT